MPGVPLPARCADRRLHAHQQVVGTNDPEERPCPHCPGTATFLRADLAGPGNILTLRGTGSTTITKVETGNALDAGRVVLIYTDAGGPAPETYSSRAYIPFTPACGGTPKMTDATAPDAPHLAE